MGGPCLPPGTQSGASAFPLLLDSRHPPSLGCPEPSPGPLGPSRAKPEKPVSSSNPLPDSTGSPQWGQGAFPVQAEASRPGPHGLRRPRLPPRSPLPTATQPQLPQRGLPGAAPPAALGEDTARLPAHPTGSAPGPHPPEHAAGPPGSGRRAGSAAGTCYFCSFEWGPRGLGPPRQTPGRKVWPPEPARSALDALTHRRRQSRGGAAPLAGRAPESPPARECHGEGRARRGRAALTQGSGMRAASSGKAAGLRGRRAQPPGHLRLRRAGSARPELLGVCWATVSPGLILPLLGGSGEDGVGSVCTLLALGHTRAHMSHACVRQAAR